MLRSEKGGKKSVQELSTLSIHISVNLKLEKNKFI